MTAKEYKVQLALGTLSHKAKVKLTRNKRTSKEILSILSKDKHYDVRYYVAKNPNTPIEVLKKLSTDASWWVRYWTTFSLKETLKK